MQVNLDGVNTHSPSPSSPPPSLSSPSPSLSWSTHRRPRPHKLTLVQWYQLTCRPTLHKPRGVGSRGAVLTLVWNTLVFGYFGTVVDGLSRYTLGSPALQPYRAIIINSFQAVTMIVLYPLAGWLADVHWGRYRTLRYSMWLMWITMLTTTTIITLHYAHPDSTTLSKVVKYGVFPTAYIIMNIGLAGFKANIIPFGTDQLQEASSHQLSAYIHWFVWTLFLSQALDQILVMLPPSYTILPIQACAQTAALSLALVLDACFSHYLIHYPGSANPLRSVMRVLRYAVQNRRPVRQPSAFSYSGSNRRPSRLDLAKSMYGGLFRTEEVEDVKTFLHMLIILLGLFGYFINNVGALRSVDNLIQHLSDMQGRQDITRGTFSNTTANFNTVWVLLFTVISIPAYELLLRPFLHCLELPMLRRAGAGLLLMLLSLIAQLGLETAQHATTHSQQCLLLTSSANTDSTTSTGGGGGGGEPNLALVYIPEVLNAVSMLLVLIGVFEFICAQTPYTMKGLLFGAFYSSNGLFLLFGYLVNLGFILVYQKGHGRSSSPLPSCGTWYYSLFITIMIVQVLVFAVLARRYRKRSRDDTPYQQSHVEEHYLQRAAINSSSLGVEQPNL